MKELYKDILNSLNKIPSLEQRKQRENKEIGELETLIISLLNPKINKSEKQKYIKKLKNKIIEINEQYHLRLGKIIKNGEINIEEVNFALEIICDTQKSKELFNKINEYKEHNYVLSEIIRNIKEKDELKNKILEHINEIKQLQETPYSNNPIKKLIEKHNRKKQINDIKQKIIKLIEKIIKDNEKLSKIKEIINQKHINLEELKKTIEKEVNHQINKLEHEKKKNIKEQSSIRSSIQIQHDKLSRIVFPNKDDYLPIISQDFFRKNQLKKDEFISKIILIIKFIDIMENNDEEAINELVQLMEQRNILNQTEDNTKEHQRRK